ncbi:MAG: rRNA maturation RNase YbeY [Rhodopseudomonas palustris]|nr:rRNA maturation RNase YbeY [Rhodopseudomonas palustris]
MLSGANMAVRADRRCRRSASLNANWRGKDKPTNVLSFPRCPTGESRESAQRHLGDIVHCLRDHARARPLPKQQAVSPITSRHLAVHGFLHLLGYDHEPRQTRRRWSGWSARSWPRARRARSCTRDRGPAT